MKYILIKPKMGLQMSIKNQSQQISQQVFQILNRIFKMINSILIKQIHTNTLTLNL